MSGSELKADLWINEYITPWDIYAHGITKVLTYQKTPYQEMYIVETGSFGKGLVLDGKWQSCTKDEFIYHEALVHPGLVAHQNAFEDPWVESIIADMLKRSQQKLLFILLMNRPNSLVRVQWKRNEP